jgi:hypothetical protein
LTILLNKKTIFDDIFGFWQAGVRRSMAQGGLMYGAGFGISAFGVMNHRDGEIRLDILCE